MSKSRLGKRVPSDTETAPHVSHRASWDAGDFARDSGLMSDADTSPVNHSVLNAAFAESCTIEQGARPAPKHTHKRDTDNARGHLSTLESLLFFFLLFS